MLSLLEIYGIGSFSAREICPESLLIFPIFFYPHAQFSPYGRVYLLLMVNFPSLCVTGGSPGLVNLSKADFDKFVWALGRLMTSSKVSDVRRIFTGLLSSSLRSFAFFGGTEAWC